MLTRTSPERELVSGERRLTRRWSSLIGPVCLLCIWQVAATPETTFYLSRPSEIAAVCWLDTTNGVLLVHSAYTVVAAALGFLLGVVFGTVAGFALWATPRLDALLSPFLTAATTIPAFAFAPLVILWFGIGVSMKVVLAGSAAFLTALFQARQGAAASVDDELRLLRRRGVGRLQLLRLVVFPGAVDWVLAGGRLSVQSAILGTFIGECISSHAGLGHYMMRAGALYDVARVWAGAVYLSLCAVIFHLAVEWLSRHRLSFIRRIAVPRAVVMNECPPFGPWAWLRGIEETISQPRSAARQGSRNARPSE